MSYLLGKKNKSEKKVGARLTAAILNTRPPVGKPKYVYFMSPFRLKYINTFAHVRANVFSSNFRRKSCGSFIKYFRSREVGQSPFKDGGVL